MGDVNTNLLKTIIAFCYASSYLSLIQRHKQKWVKLKNWGSLAVLKHVRTTIGQVVHQYQCRQHTRILALRFEVRKVLFFDHATFTHI